MTAIWPHGDGLGTCAKLRPPSPIGSKFPDARTRDAAVPSLASTDGDRSPITRRGCALPTATVTATDPDRSERGRLRGDTVISVNGIQRTHPRPRGLFLQAGVAGSNQPCPHKRQAITPRSRLSGGAHLGRRCWQPLAAADRPRPTDRGRQLGHAGGTHQQREPEQPGRRGSPACHVIPSRRSVACTRPLSSGARSTAQSYEITRRHRWSSPQ